MNDSRAMDLSKPLPAGVVIGEFGTGLFYEKYAAFTWAWAWRRTLLLSVVAVPFGAVVGVTHGMYAHDLAQGFAVGVRFAAGNLLMVGLAPALAAVVRQQRLAWSTERVLVVVAVVLGVCGALLAKAHAHNYHDHLMGSASTVVGRLIELLTGQVSGHAVASGISDLILYVGLYAVSGGALALRSYMREPQRWQEHLQRIEMDAVRGARLDAERRLALLQAQVEPHFLFNTLASARSLAQVEPRRAAALIDALANYLRSTLPRLRNDPGARLSNLAEQFEICRGYLHIMNLRLGERLTFHVRLPDELLAQPFPPLLLISLVENAVTHGVEPKVGAATIAIEARCTGGAHALRLEIDVLDDGVGLREGLVEGTGLANVREQLRMIYGEQGELQVQSSNDQGVLARIIVPLQESTV
jgi:hypothetical protein